MTCKHGKQFLGTCKECIEETRASLPIRSKNFVENFWKWEKEKEEKMPTGKKIIEEVEQAVGPDYSLELRARVGLKVHSKLLEIHSRALACHSECLGMNSENSWAVCNDNAPPYNDRCYKEVMEKWGMMDEEGEPII